MREYDVIVVGAGPAGSTAAKHLADRGRHVLLADQARFPRQKVCAAWLSVHAFAAFPYLESRRKELLESDFFGIAFFSPDLAKRAAYRKTAPTGFLSTRLRMDAVLKDIAGDSGVEFQEGQRLTRLSHERDRVQLEFAGGLQAIARVVVGADGVGSTVAHLAGLRRGWTRSQICACINEDVPYPRHRLDLFYGSRRLIYVVPLYRGLAGYAWMFPKRDHVCIGLGGRPGSTGNLSAMLAGFAEDLRRKRLIPDDLRLRKPKKAAEPAGAMNTFTNTGRDRVLLTGDAAGFVSGSTGEGIYPGMLAARGAAECIDDALRSDQIRLLADSYRRRWQQDLAGFRSGSGAVQAGFGKRFDQVFKFRVARNVAARHFLFGERIQVGMMIRAFFER